ncbi:hypothetical protein [Micromonospora sp. HUAS LYJ1]|uniref:hypothetical protein n=1 Tax=Micromonospora sp. HUAS LYJ1 TaxID=3061626 RepID=UPI0026714C83|nr:hypothetical protein [Micromonospora sp. HUAS LYJ1]WKU03412.1 hypothetical protein Q2K16_21495 [Micromonospora sp. HUAS LYJ1]
MARHRHAIPHTVTDVLLWLLATDVAAAHQPHPHNPDRCTNLRCTNQAYPCLPARDAHRAQQAATATRPRARVTSALTGWFRPSRALPNAA